MKSTIKNILNLLRIRQYYKNILIFVGSFFGGKLLDISLLPLLILGFIILCCASSINYIINDIMDIEKDKLHPEKLEKKALASGKLSVKFALALITFLSAVILILLIFLIPNLNFIIMLVLVFGTGQLYNYFFKRFAFIDVLVLALIYLWRALAGCVLINVVVSPWLILAVYESALFLVIAKRKGDLILLGEEKAKVHKKIYKQYNMKLLEQFHTITAATILIIYIMYLISQFYLFEDLRFFYQYLIILSIPTLFYIIMRYMFLTSSKPEIARSTEKVIFDKGILIAGLFLGAIFFFTFYYIDIKQILYDLFKISLP
ncbi:MAG: UbiA prenyltransferase family protein [Promethearchaeota archaeon]